MLTAMKNESGVDWYNVDPVGFENCKTSSQGREAAERHEWHALFFSAFFTTKESRAAGRSVLLRFVKAEANIKFQIPNPK